MTTIKYITIREFSDYHSLEPELLEEFVREGLIRIHELKTGPCIEEDDIEPLETMIRLHNDLGINPAGVETIMHMRKRLKNMQDRMKEMEYQLRRYEQLMEKLF